MRLSTVLILSSKSEEQKKLEKPQGAQLGYGIQQFQHVPMKLYSKSIPVLCCILQIPQEKKLLSLFEHLKGQ